MTSLIILHVLFAVLMCVSVCLYLTLDGHMFKKLLFSCWLFVLIFVFSAMSSVLR